MSDHEAAQGTRDPLPLLLRVAGLSTVDLEPFSSDLPLRVARHAELAKKLAVAREALVDRLYRSVPEADPEVRGVLLDVKRDAYNGRPLAPHREHSQWAEVTRVAGETVARVVALEAELETARRDYEAAYERRCRAEHRQLLELRTHRRFVRGLALASPVLAAGIARLPEAFDGPYDRKQRKAAQSLLRYASRAVCKLSPYSTLTPVALAEARDGHTGGPRWRPETELDLHPGPWSEWSLLRARRFVPSRWVHLLFSHPPLRRRLRVALNGSLTEIAPGRLLVLRPGAWTTSEEGRLEYRPDAVVTLGLQGPLVEWLRAELPRREPTYRELLSELAEGLTPEGQPAPTREDLTAAVEQLLDAGLLVLRTPWPLYEAHLEQRLLEYLKEITLEGTSHEEQPGEERAALAPVIGALERLLELQLGYRRTEEPARVVRRLQGLLGEIWDALLGLVDPPRDIEADRSGANVFYEDVFLTPRGGGTEGGDAESCAPTGPEPDGPVAGLLELPRETVTELYETAAPLLRISDLANRRHDLRLALAARMERQWPERTEVGLVELFAAVQDLWKDFTRFDLEARRRSPGGAGGATFDPLGLPAAAELREERRRVFEALSGRVESDGHESRLERRELGTIAGTISRRWSPPTAAALLVQPADPAGRLWVLNRLAEGTGRLGSRFTPVMDPSDRCRVLSHLVARSVLESDGERFELLDLPSIQGDTLNVHAPQTLRLLEPPGETLDLPPERRVFLGELRLRRTGDGDLRLIDGRGRNLLPVYLGVADLVYLPGWVRFLARLGPGELEILRPGSTVRTTDGLAVRERLTLGRLVLYRRRWRIAPGRRPGRLGRHADPETFAALHRWRQELELPRRFYVIERRPAPDPRPVFKPQYVDLSSPLFADIFLGILDQQGDEPLVLEEALPAPDAYPGDGGKGRRAVEVVIEGLSLQPPLSPEERGP